MSKAAVFRADPPRSLRKRKTKKSHQIKKRFFSPKDILSIIFLHIKKLNNSIETISISLLTVFGDLLCGVEN